MTGEPVVLGSGTSLAGLGFVTGGGAGIGRSIAISLASHGARVAVLDIDFTGAQATADEIAAAGGEAVALAGDVSSPADIEAAVDAVVAMWGPLRYAVNNAGIEGRRDPIAELDLETFDRVVSVNLRGTFICMREELRVMLAHNRGAIVNVASAAGVVPAPDLPAYAASKAGVIQLSRSAALDYGRHGIRVNALCPGPVRTAMQQRLRGAAADLESAAVPLGRTADVAEIAAAAVWLCSDAASYVTGHAMVVDGGCLVQGPRVQAVGEAPGDQA